jgi:Uma2 family endonuclease
MVTAFAIITPVLALLWGGRLMVAILNRLDPQAAPYLASAELALSIVLALGLALVLTYVAKFCGALHSASERCLPLDRAAEKFGNSVADLDHWVQSRGLQPKYIVDGVPVFDPDLLSEAAHLLRAASAPSEQTLLRTPVQTAAESTLLVRPHSATLSVILELLAGLFGLPRVRVQSPITIPGEDGVYNEPEPDLVVTSGRTTDYLKKHPQPEDLLLVVEVSDASLNTDLILKARLYARAGIAEYWVLDLAARRLHVHRSPINGEYADVAPHSDAETITISAKPEQPIRVADLLPPIG